MWNEVALYSPWIKSFSNEKLGYMTQKPRALLERIISVSSNKGDIVLDPFCGCGTTVEAAQELGRRWIGIDITQLAVALIKHRLQLAFPNDKAPRVIGEPESIEDAAQLAKDDPYQFQWWALGLVGARPIEQKKGADQGIDGRLFFRDSTTGDLRPVILSVKAGGVTSSHVRDLRGVAEREGADIGVLISFEPPTQPMKKEAATAGFYTSAWGKHPKIQLLTVRELLEGKKLDIPPATGAIATYEKAQTAPRRLLKVAEAPSLFGIDPEPPKPGKGRRKRK